MSVDVLSILENIKKSYEDPIYMDELEEVQEENTRDLDTAIEILRHKERIDFNQATLNLILDEIVEEYFAEELYDFGLMDVIEAVKAKYADVIATLEID